MYSASSIHSSTQSFDVCIRVLRYIFVVLSIFGCCSGIMCVQSTIVPLSRAGKHTLCESVRCVCSGKKPCSEEHGHTNGKKCLLFFMCFFFFLQTYRCCAWLFTTVSVPSVRTAVFAQPITGNQKKRRDLHLLIVRSSLVYW